MAARYNRTGGFACDYQSKLKLAKQIIKNGQEKGNIIKFAEIGSGDTEHIDMHCTAYTSAGTEIARYALEAKERPDTGHTTFEKPGFDPIIELPKIKSLRESQKEGYIPLYAYLFQDNYYAIWVVNDSMGLHPLGTLNVKPHTQGYLTENKKPMEKWGAPLSTAKVQGYLTIPQNNPDMI